MAQGVSDTRAPAWRALPRMLAGFFPVGVFGLVLLWAMGEWGVALGILAGTALGAAAAWALTRLIAAYPLVQWIAAAVIGVLLILVALSFL